MFTILLVVFAVLSLLLAAWTLFFQGYIYSEPAEGVFWRAPAAGAALTLFLGIWVALDSRSIESPTDEGRYRPLQELSTSETETYDKLTIKNQEGKKELYTRRGNQYMNESGKRLPERPFEIIATDKDGREHIYKPKMENGIFQKEKDGTVRYYEEGNPSRYMEEAYIGQIGIFHAGWLATGLLLNFGLLLVWFLCLWLLLRFQWSHALGLAFVAWLICLFVLPMLLTPAELERKDRLLASTIKTIPSPISPAFATGVIGLSRRCSANHHVPARICMMSPSRTT